MKCPECGADLSGEDKFCNNCGAAIPGGASSDPETPQTPQPAPESILEDDAQLEPIEPAEPDTVAEIGISPAAAPLPVPATGSVAEPPAAFEPAPAAPPPPPPVAKVKGKSNTGLIVAIVVLVLLLLCCCCAIGVIVANFDQISAALEGMSY